MTKAWASAAPLVKIPPVSVAMSESAGRMSFGVYSDFQAVMAASPLIDLTRFTRAHDGACRRTWQAWLDLSEGPAQC